TNARPMTFFNSGSIEESNVATQSITQASGVNTMGSLTITNSHTAARYFITNVRFHLRADDGSDDFDVNLVIDGVSGQVAKDTVRALAFEYGSDVNMSHAYLIPAGESITYLVLVQHIAGGAGDQARS